MKIKISRIFLLILIISPLLSITGENDFSTSLNVAALLKLPSLNSINYLFLILFFFGFIALNALKGTTNFIISAVCIVCLLFFVPRHPTFYSLIGVITMLSYFLVFMKDKSDLTNFSEKDYRILYKTYLTYIIVGAIVHFYLLMAQGYYANDRMMGIFKNPNQFGFFVVGVYLLYILKIKRSQASYGFMFFIFSLVMVVLSGSRSALLTIILVHIAYQLMNRRWSYLALLLVVGSAFSVLLLYIGSDQIIEIISRRNVDNVNEVGNMRLKIFLDTWNTNSAWEMILGRSTSEGTNGMIYEQRNSGQSILWADSLITVFFYNWGLVGLGLFVFFMGLDFLTQVPVITRNSMIIILYFVSAFFFVMGDFFPLPFLIVLLKNNLERDA